MWQAIKAILVFFISQVVFQLPVIILSSFVGINTINAEYIGLIVSSVAVIWYFRSEWKISVSSIEFNQHLWPTFGLCICIAPFLIIVSAIPGIVLDLPNNTDFHLEDIPFPLALMTIGVLGPIAEEVAFRGGVLGSLLKWEKIEGRPWVAILISAMFFSIVHLNPAQVPATLILGLVAGWLYFKTGSLIPGIVLHIMNNSAACAIEAISEGSNIVADVEEWEPSTATLILLLAISLIMFMFLFCLMAKITNRDFPDRSIWGSTRQSTDDVKKTAKILGICSGIFAAIFTVILVRSDRLAAKNNLIYTFEDFHDGLARVKMEGKFGYIDRSGNIVIPYVYDSALGFNEGLCCVEKDGHYGAIDRDGKTVIPFEYDSVMGYGFNEGLCCVEKDGYWGYIDRDGKVAIPMEYSSAREFSNGLAWVCKEGKKGYIDKDGNAVEPLEYDDFYSFHDGLAMVSKDGLYGFIYSGGDLAIPIEYGSATLFKDGFSIVSKDGKYGSIDINGTVIIPLQYDYLRTVSDNLFLAESGDNDLIINSKNEIISLLENKSVMWYSDGVAMVELDGDKSALVNNEGEILKEFDYVLLSGLKEGLAHARKGKKEGFVNSTGDIVIPFTYDNAALFSDGLARVCKGMHRYYIDASGEILLELD